jgi:hypothetical protein
MWEIKKRLMEEGNKKLGVCWIIQTAIQIIKSSLIIIRWEKMHIYIYIEYN